MPEPELMTLSEFLIQAWAWLLPKLPVWIIGAVVTAYFVRWIEGEFFQRAAAAVFWPLFWPIWFMTGALSPPARWLRARIPEWIGRLDRSVSVAMSTKMQEDEFGELLHGPMPGGGRATWIRVKDETGTHIIRADPNSGSAHAAVAASFGKSVDTYQPDAES